MIFRSTCSLRPHRRRRLDFESTDDPLHGNQERRFFHGYYGCYLPLYVVCGNHVP